MTFTGFASGTYDLDRLDSFLGSPDRSDDDMMIEQLDGYLTAIALSPRMMMPSEWLPRVWDEEGPVFADQEEAQAIYGAILGLYNDNLQALADPDTPFEPILFLDMDDSVMIEPWAEGFMLGIALQSDDWKPLMEDETLGGAIGLLAAVSLGGGEGGASPVPMPKKERELLYREVPRILPSLLKDIRAFWQERGLAPGPAPVPPGPTMKSLWLMQTGIEAHDDEAPAAPLRSTKVGRNEPCPCGSGKKYKRCCGA